MATTYVVSMRKRSVSGLKDGVAYPVAITTRSAVTRPRAVTTVTPRGDGSMLSTGLNYIQGGNYWWLIYPPGIAIILTCISFNFIGDALRDAFETRLQRR